MRERLSTDAESQVGRDVLAKPLDFGRIEPRQLIGASKLLLLLLNFVPLLHVAAIVGACLLPLSAGFRVGAAIVALYLLPPLCGRLLLPVPEGRIRVGSAAFFKWWSLLQLQMLFNRFPAFEEVLRLVPGLYSGWLRLWGARIGRLTYWAPGTLILDRSFLEIGDSVVFGAGVRLNPHVIANNSTGEAELLLAAIRIGSGAQVGGYSLLTAGTVIAEKESTRAFLISPPFSHWKGGKRAREEHE